MLLEAQKSPNLGLGLGLGFESGLGLELGLEPGLGLGLGGVIEEVGITNLCANGSPSGTASAISTNRREVWRQVQ